MGGWVDRAREVFTHVASYRGRDTRHSALPYFVRVRGSSPTAPVPACLLSRIQLGERGGSRGAAGRQKGEGCPSRGWVMMTTSRCEPPLAAARPPSCACGCVGGSLLSVRPLICKCVSRPSGRSWCTLDAGGGWAMSQGRLLLLVADSGGVGPSVFEAEIGVSRGQVQPVRA